MGGSSRLSLLIATLGGGGNAKFQMVLMRFKAMMNFCPFVTFIGKSTDINPA
jgi:hypothetical protein